MKRTATFYVVFRRGPRSGEARATAVRRYFPRCKQGEVIVRLSVALPSGAFDGLLVAPPVEIGEEHLAAPVATGVVKPDTGGDR